MVPARQHGHAVTLLQVGQQQPVHPGIQVGDVGLFFVVGGRYPCHVEQVMSDIDRDRFMAPDDAIEYGLIDNVMVRAAVAV